jgi:hypothetical protein
MSMNYLTVGIVISTILATGFLVTSGTAFAAQGGGGGLGVLH